ncbi:hypothetical protein [Actinomyces ruminicola]|uniref:Uncharacterized protein n=1 Tax=Actinomyces ruminicola TaxID=332524 RepID=A0A1G9WTK3_9ACTO|nr:hypothetical protein [Actinomyces ruminicola]SDM87727.1 hypothetical protein SAMN04487766_10839 [Actinomyces ruminicola]
MSDVVEPEHEWESFAGHDWMVHTGSIEPGQAALGLNLDYGAVDEAPAALDTLARLCGALQAELQRPVELGVGDVSVPEAEASFTATRLTIAVWGRREAVLRAWAHLGELFADPQQLSTDAKPVPRPGVVWDRDLATYVGTNTQTLGNLRIHAPDSEAAWEAVRALLAHLDPRRGEVRHVFETNDPYLVGVGWTAQPAYGTAPARPPLYLDRRPALLPCNDDGRILLSAVGNPGANTLVAMRALARQTIRTLREFNVYDDLGLNVVELRDVAYCCIHLDEQVPTSMLLRRIIEQLIHNPLPIPDAVVDGALEEFGAEQIAALDRHLRLTGRSAELHPTSAGVRHAYDQLCASVHIPLNGETEALANRYGYLVWALPEEPTRLEVSLPRDPAGARDISRPESVCVGEHTLSALWHERRRGDDGTWRLTGNTSVRWADMSRLQLTGYDADSQVLMLVDDRMRRVFLPWDEIAARPALRAEIERFGIWRAPRAQLGD